MSILDPAKNFGKCEVSIGYNATASTIVLVAGEGAKLPNPAVDGEFNLVWWDWTLYTDPADDPNVEIVRVTARSTDTLTLENVAGVRTAQEGTASTNKNTGGSTYRMVLGWTKKMRDDVETKFVAKDGSNSPLTGILKTLSVFPNSDGDEVTGGEAFGYISFGAGDSVANKRLYWGNINYANIQSLFGGTVAIPDNIADYGDVDSGTTTTLTDTSKSWTPNAFVGRLVRKRSTLSIGKYHEEWQVVTSNTATVLTIVGSFVRTPVADDLYDIATDGKRRCVIGHLHRETEIKHYGDVYPGIDGVFDLGKVSADWKHLYLRKLKGGVTHITTYPALQASRTYHLLGTTSWTDATISVFAAQPDVPRNIIVYCVADPFTNMTGTVTVNGTDADGVTISEVVTVSVTAGTIVTLYTNRAFGKVTSIVVDQTDGGAMSTFQLGISDKLGLPNYPFNNTTDVFKVNKNKLDITVPTVNTTYGTVDCGTIVANDAFIFWCNPFK